jgi:diaminopimelate epimerase
MPLPFLKMHGLGNDFVIIDSRADGYVPDPETCRKIADRHRGVGYDQLIVLLKPKAPEADLFMLIVNADGTEAGACANATRCVAHLLFEETGRDQGVIETKPGLLKVWKEKDDFITADFGPPRLTWNEIPLAHECDTLTVGLNHPPLLSGVALAKPDAGGSKSLCDFGGGSIDLPPPCCVSMGNPHAVFFVPDAEAVPLSTVGPKLEVHPMFPERCNIEFAHIIDRQHIRMRVWERGTGITEACGSGACATLVAAVRRGLADRRATILLDGGELAIEWRESDGHVLITGPATLAFKGELEEI